jgi:hypothetical protein
MLGARQAPVRVSAFDVAQRVTAGQSNAHMRLPCRRCCCRSALACLAFCAVLSGQAAAETEGPMIVTQKKELKLLTPKYCESIHQTRRRPTRTVDVGSPRES